MRKKILISGGLGKFANQLLIKGSENFDISAPSRQEMDVRNPRQIYSEIVRFNPDYFIHAAAMTRPMKNHEIAPMKSMRINIEGTCNVVEACSTTGLKLIYISTDYVYPGKSGSYSEEDGVLPFTKYAWSKLGGECAVRMYDNSLILRIAMCERPFPHPGAMIDVKKSSIFSDEAAKITLQLLGEFGIINIGGPNQSIYDFVKGHQEVKPITRSSGDSKMMPDVSMNTDKLNEISRRR
jgi:dTDP-4-dehydrorhamnose reductase